MTLNESKYKEVIGQYFDYSFDWDFLGLVADVLDIVDNERKENPPQEEEIDQINDAMDRVLIHNACKWEIIKHYQTPEEANYQNAIDVFFDDICALRAKIAKNQSKVKRRK